MEHLHHFRYWCYHVLPLVYDDSLSYYEVLCKVVQYINKLIEQDNAFAGDIEQLRKDLDQVQHLIDNFDTEYLEQVVRDHLARCIFPEINDAGYIVYNIPLSWDTLELRTTGLDYETDLCPEFGHLVLLY